MQLFKPVYRVEEILKDLRPVLESGWTGTGPKCKEFERVWNKYTGAKHSHFVNSATAALHIAMRICDLPEGSKVLTTPLTFVSTNAVILYEKHIPIFVDISDHDLSLDATDFINKKDYHDAKAGIWVHYGGHAGDDFTAMMNSLDKNNFSLIEDCAHAAGGFYTDGKRIGSRNDTISCFSFQAVKNLPTFDSGLISVSDEKTLERVKKLAWLGIDKDTYSRTNEGDEIYKWKYSVDELGWKYNGNDVAATVALTQLKYLDHDNAYRKQLYQWYTALLEYESFGRIKIVHSCYDSSHHLVVIRVKNRDEVLRKLKEKNIAPGVHYLPNYEFPVFSKYYEKGSCPNAEKISKEILSLPNHLGMTFDDVKRISEVVLNAAE